MLDSQSTRGVHVLCKTIYKLAHPYEREISGARESFDMKKSISHIISKRSVVAVVLALPLLSACLHSSETFSKKSIEGKVFAKELARLYQEFSASEVYLHDWKDAKYFADKGLRAASGIEVDPEHPEDWDIPATKVATVLEARRTLLDALTGDNIKAYPKLAAKAHFEFDCWVEELEEWEQNNIEACKIGFYETLDLIVNPPKSKMVEAKKDDSKAAPVGLVTESAIPKVKKIDDTLMNADEAKFVEANTITFIKEKPAPKKAANATGEEDAGGYFVNDGGGDAAKPVDAALAKGSYFVFFGDTSAEISSVGTTIIKEITEDIKPLKHFEITVLGYISNGEASLGEDLLAEKRAEAVYNALVKNGVDKDVIDYYGFSDANTSGDEETEDSAKSLRRVEIFIK
jgi:outer membrane protein OmpA-like peptidoglycan-associated protein